MNAAPQPTLGAAPTPITVQVLVAREATRKKRRHRLWFAGAALAVILCGVLWLALRPRPAPFESLFRLEAVTRGDIAREVRATGHVEALSTVLVGAEISGRIATVEADFNDQVKAGQLLAQFDRSALEAQAAQALAALATARASLEQARVDSEQAKRDLQRSTRLAIADASTTAAQEAAQSAALLAEARVKAAEAQVAAQLAGHQLARVNLDHAVIRAPIDGVVITRNVDPGQTVASVLQTPVLFELAADLRKMRVITAVDEADIGEVKVGQEARFTVDAYPARVFVGRVTEVRNSPLVVQDVVTYGTVVELDNLELLLKPGMTAPVRISTGAASAVLRVPAAALHFTPPKETPTGTTSIWVARKDHLERIDVEVGVSDGELTAIAAPGVAVDDRVAIDLSMVGRKTYGLSH